MRLEVFGEGEWARRVAEEWMNRIHAHPSMRMVLPTGGTPRPLYREFAARSPNLGNSEVYVLDEFVGLPPGHPARCDVMIQRDLIDLLDEPPILGALDPAADDLVAEAARYTKEVTSGIVDLTMLGLGLNGHVALNEPGSRAEDRARVVDLHPDTIASIDAEPAPKEGVTLGLAEILASEEVWLLVTGAGKADILVRVLEGPVGPEVPATYLRDHPNALVFADEPAASKMSR